MRFHTNDPTFEKIWFDLIVQTLVCWELDEKFETTLNWLYSQLTDDVFVFPSHLRRSICWRKGRAACCRPSAPGRAPTAAPPARSAPPLPPSVSPSSPRPPRPPRLRPTTAGPADTSSARTTTRTTKTRARFWILHFSSRPQSVLPVNWAVE